MSYISGRVVSRILDTNGNGTGTKNAIGDYDSNTEFFIQPSSTDIFRVEALVVLYSGSGPFSPTKYGGTATLGSTDGVSISHHKGGSTSDMMDGVPVGSNSEWFRLSGPNNSVSTVDDCCSIVTITCELILNGLDNDKVSVVMKGNYSSLDTHYYTVYGQYLREWSA
jgi:hypothetical protein